MSITKKQKYGDLYQTLNKGSTFDFINNHEFCKGIFENLPVAVLIIDKKGIIKYINRMIYDWLGYHPKDIIGKNVVKLNFLTKPSRELVKSKLNKRQSDKKSFLYELIFNSCKGDKKIGRVRSIPMINKAGEIQGSLILVSNITEFKKSEEMLRIKNSAIKNSINAILIGDMSGRITYVNPSFVKLWGFKNEKEILHKKTSDFWHTKKGAVEIMKIIRSKGEWMGDLTAKRKDGTLFDVHLSGSLIKDDSGKPIRIMGSFVDVTKQKQLDIAKSEFIAIASHQLRNPLAIISWYSEMLFSMIDDKNSSREKRYLKEIYESNLHLIELVNGLLNASRIELGTFSLKLVKIDLVILINQIFGMLMPQIKAKFLKINSQFFPKSLIIKSDSVQIRIILQNLISNAIKYTPKKGKINVIVRKNKKEFLIKVSDTGYGIPKNEQAKIFNRFFRASNVVEKEKDGTGLGLYITKSLVEELGGKIWFESGNGKGTIFYVSFPNKLSK